MKKTIALLLAVIMVFSMVACAAKEPPVAPEKPLLRELKPRLKKIQSLWV